MGHWLPRVTKWPPEKDGTATPCAGGSTTWGLTPRLSITKTPNAGWVEGYVRTVTWDQLTGSLDSYEGVGEGLYRRVTTCTREGRRVWMYVYDRPLPPSAVGPLDRWRSAKRVRLLPPPTIHEGGS